MPHASMMNSRAHRRRSGTFAVAGRPFADTFVKPLTPAVLDCMAGIELQHGHHVRAEYLAQLAADMREAGR
jgi:hypothetical protein